MSSSSLHDLLTMTLHTSGDALGHLDGRELWIGPDGEAIRHVASTRSAIDQCLGVLGRLDRYESPASMQAEIRQALECARDCFLTFAGTPSSAPGGVAEVLDQSNLVALCELSICEMERRHSPAAEILGLQG